jgi:chitodextrinase
VRLTWNAATDNVGVTGYRVYRNGALLASPAATSYTDYAVSRKTTYRYAVRALDAAGNVGAQSATVYVTTR